MRSRRDPIRIPTTSWITSVKGQISEECQKPLLLLKKVLQYTSNLYCNTPPIYIAVLSVPLSTLERENTSILLPFVSQCASHLYRNTPPICIAILLEKSWWSWSPGCSPKSRFSNHPLGKTQKIEAPRCLRK